jgi:hypothetical protein
VITIPTKTLPDHDKLYAMVAKRSARGVDVACTQNEARRFGSWVFHHWGPFNKRLAVSKIEGGYNLRIVPKD